MLTEEMEARLQELVTANEEDKRSRWAKEWKESGDTVVGVLCTYVPVEILVAANVMPWRVSGTWSQKIDGALAIRQSNSCGFCNHVLQSLLDGDFEFLDGVVATTWEQDLTRLWDVWKHLGKTSFNHILHLPHMPTPEAIKYYAGELGALVTALEAWTGRRITEGDLRRSVDRCDKRRALLADVYELQKRDHPALSGAEMVGLCLAGTLMPIDRFNGELENLMPFLKRRKAPLAITSPRVLVSSDLLDNPGFVEAIERLGCVVAMDDLDTGYRYYTGQVDRSGDVLEAIAARYLLRPGSPRMADWERQVAAVVELVQEHNIAGVIELPQKYSRAREMRRSYFLSELRKAGVMAISLEREYPLTNLGQLRVRAQAFIEMLAA